MPAVIELTQAAMMRLGDLAPAHADGIWAEIDAFGARLAKMLEQGSAMSRLAHDDDAATCFATIQQVFGDLPFAAKEASQVFCRLMKHKCNTGYAVVSLYLNKPYKQISRAVIDHQQSCREDTHVARRWKLAQMLYDRNARLSKRP